ncbi:MAG: hypothetical protein IJ061_01995 [Lachnospiraceae bacterium]|nr:hypothetical protein [Lachnospiraceae bacterium]
MIWMNPALPEFEQREKIGGYSFVYVQAAQNRFMRFLPFTAIAFPEVSARKGVIESALREADEAARAEFQKAANAACGSLAQECGLRLFTKDDAAMPVRGGTDVRGGFHAVFKAAEFLAQDAGLLKPTDNYACLVSEEYREFFKRHTIAVKNADPQLTEAVRTAAESLGFGFRITDGRATETETEIDGRSSEDLFFGYATAAVRLKVQLFKTGAAVDQKHPLFVYIPADKPMALAGIAFGIKEVFGSAAHIFALGEESQRHLFEEKQVEISGKDLLSGMLQVLITGILRTPEEVFGCGLRPGVNEKAADHVREAVHVIWSV